MNKFVHPEYLVETDWLAQHLHDADVRVIDATTHLLPWADNVLYDVKPGREDFERAHIPGAVFIDIDNELSDHTKQTHFMMPPAEQFAAVMSKLGIGSEHFIVTYATAHHYWATRMWWMLRAFGHDRVAVLNGGFQKWQRENRPTESGAPKPQAQANFRAQLRAGWVADQQQVLAAISDPATRIVNALRPEQHAGTSGVNYGRKGRIPGSVNIPALQLVDQNNVYKPVEELSRMCEPALDAQRVIAYCGGGIAATSAALVLTMLGHNNVQLYDASLSEWAPNSALPMEL